MSALMGSTRMAQLLPYVTIMHDRGSGIQYHFYASFLWLRLQRSLTASVVHHQGREANFYEGSRCCFSSAFANSQISRQTPMCVICHYWFGSNMALGSAFHPFSTDIVLLPDNVLNHPRVSRGHRQISPAWSSSCCYLSIRCDRFYFPCSFRSSLYTTYSHC